MSIPYKWIAIGIAAILCIGILGMVVWNPATVIATPEKVNLFVTHGSEELYVASTLGCPRIVTPSVLTPNSTLDVKYSLMVSDEKLTPIANDGYFQINEYHYLIAINGVVKDSKEYLGSETKYSKSYEAPIQLNGASEDFELPDYGASPGDNITISAQVSYHSVHQEYIGDTGIPIEFSEDRTFDQGLYRTSIPGGDDDDDDQDDDGKDNTTAGCTWTITAKKNSYSGAVIPGATVIVNGITQTTGADGKTTFTGLPSGPNTATVSATGYVTTTITTTFASPTGVNEDTAVMAVSSGTGGDDDGHGTGGNETEEFDWMPTAILGAIGGVVFLVCILGYSMRSNPVYLFIGVCVLAICLAVGFMLSAGMISFESSETIAEGIRRVYGHI